MFSRHFANLMSNCGRLCVALVSTSNAATTTVTTTTVTTTSAVSPTVETTTTTTTTNNKNDERLNANDIIDDDNYNNSNRNFYNYFSNSNNNDNNNNNFNNNFNSIDSNSNNNNDNSISPTAIPFPPPSGKHLDDKIAIIGGGWSGLAVLKELKAYGFRNIRLLESHEDIGGQWNINNPETQTWSNVRANISKMNMHYPDYPYPIDPKEPLHCTIGELHQYLHNYANEFNLFPNIQFHSRVNAIEPIDPNDTAASKWNVRYIRTDVDKNKEVVETFDRVVVCTGRFGQPRAAPLPGNYTGEIKKLTDIKSTNFTGKKLVVIGNSISAIDVMELACLNGAYDITCVYRTPRWYVSMWLPDGTPFEQSSRKYGDLDLLRKRMDKGSIQLTRYGFVKPNVKDVESGKLKTGISLCRSFEYWVKKGRIRGCHGSIVNCEGKNVTLSNGTTLEGVDMILLTTGFDPNVPVLPRDLFSRIYRPELKERRFLLYLLTFIPGWYNQSLAFVGIQPIVESNPTMFELQARMIGHYWSAGGSLALPHKTPEAQNKWIEKNIVKLDYSPLLPDIARQSYHIADEIADFIGCRPTDAELVNLLDDAGFIPEQYRIVGPHKNEKAYARMKWKLENRFKDTPENMLKHIRLVGKVSPAKLYLQKYIFTGIRPLLTRQDKKSQRRNREKYEQELQREREEEERLLREQENQQKSG